MSIFTISKAILLFAIILFTPAISMAQEICNNLIDDDGDGLIDVFDPDCICTTLDSIEFIPNGGFELKSECCTMLSPTNNCLENWEILQGTPDLYDPACLTTSDIQDVLSLFGIDLQSTMINFGVAGNFSESFGTCLLGTLNQGESYLFTANYAQTDIFAPDAILEGQMTLYGYPSCAELENHVYGDSPCDNSPAPIELGSFLLQDYTNNGWLDLNIPITPPVDINAIAMRINCQNMSSSNQGIFLSMDDLSIVNTEAIVNEDTIAVEGDVCESSFLLQVPNNVQYEYQWYKDGIPIPGETNNQLELNGQNPVVEGNYLLAIYFPSGCIFWDDFQLVVPTIDQEEFYTICEGDSVFVVGQWWYDTGDYTVNYLDTISPCQIKLEFHIDLYENYEDITRDTICDGDTYVFRGMNYSLAGVYYDSLQSSMGCDSLYILELITFQSSSETLVASTCFSEPYLWEGNLYDESGIYMENHFSQFGCDSTLILELTVADIIIGDTLFIELMENEYYIFQGDTLSEIGNYQDTLNSSSGCDSVAFLSISFAPPCFIDAIIESSDLPCDFAMNGTISISPTFPSSTYQVSIDGGENFLPQTEFNNLNAGTYEVYIIDGMNCLTELGTIELITFDNLNATISPDTTVEKGGAATLTVIQANFDIETVYWNSEDESCNDCISLVASPEVTTTYTATIVDENGCVVVLETTIFVREETGIYTPNIFSPNEDGINDNFRVFTADNKDAQIQEFAVYDRWGNLVHSEKDVSFSSMRGWNGKKNGRSVSQGVYGYYVAYTDANNEESLIRGSITIIK